MATRLAPDHRHANAKPFDLVRLKARVPLSEVAGRMTRLRRAAGGAKGLCPFHDEKTPSFFVDDAKGLWHCFGCGRGGDAIALLVEAGADGFLDACSRLAELAADAPDRRSIGSANHAPQDSNGLLRIRLARAAWRSGGPVAGTPAQDYLAERGLSGDVPGSLRFGRIPAFWDADNGEPGPRRPALIAAAQDIDGRITGVQRVFLDERRRGFPFRPLRLSLGRIRGSALRLGPAREEIMLTGSLEDGLALMRMFVGASVWATLGEANLAGVILPPIVRSLFIYGDADDPGRAAAARAREAHEARGLHVAELFPRLGKDANAEWIARCG